MSIKLWNILKLNKQNAQNLAEKYDIPVFLAMLLDARKKISANDAEDILFDDYFKLADVNFADMEKAVTRVKIAIKNKEKICVCGDYDADGVTATALIYAYLKKQGANVIYYIPRREGDGYGLNVSIIDRLKDLSVGLILTVDNGITACKEIDYAKSFNIDTVVTDHHKVPEVLPNAVAVVDPHRDDCKSKFKDFAGVGLAFKLVVALEGAKADIDKLIDEYIELCLIGTVGDIVPLKGENRLLVKKGLEHIKNTKIVGMRSLLEKSGMLGKNITANRLAFTLIPRINAAGRLSSTDKVVRLFSTNEKEKADEIAEELERENELRKSIDMDILEQVQAILQDEPYRLHEKILIVDGDNWHPGVIGIVAAKLVDKYGKPAIVITRINGLARGSARSVEGFSIYDAINVCSSYLVKFGGHPMAAGFDVASEDVKKMRQDIKAYVEDKEVPFPRLNVTFKLNPSVLSLDIVNHIKALEPFGKDNPEVLFGLYDMTLGKISAVGGGKHLRLEFLRDDKSITMMKFFTTPAEFYYKEGDILDLVVTLSSSEFNGRESLSVFIEDIKFSGQDNEILLKERRVYDSVKRNIMLPQEIISSVYPTRADFAHVYKFLKNTEKFSIDINVLYFRIKIENMNFCKLLVILDVLEELGIISMSVDGDIYNIEMNKTTQKVDLGLSDTLKSMKNGGK